MSENRDASDDLARRLEVLRNSELDLQIQLGDEAAAVAASAERTEQISKWLHDVRTAIRTLEGHREASA